MSAFARSGGCILDGGPIVHGIGSVLGIVGRKISDPVWLRHHSCAPAVSRTLEEAILSLLPAPLRVILERPGLVIYCVGLIKYSFRLQSVDYLIDKA